MSTRSDQEDDYDLAPDPAPVQAARQPAAPLTYESKTSRKPVEQDAETIKNLHIPIGLLTGGLVVETIGALVTTGRSPGALAEVAIDVVATTAFLLVGLLLAARWRQIALGDFRIVVLKLAALSVAPSALLLLAMPVLRFIPLGGLIGLAGEFVLYFALLGVLFDLDESDTWYCVWVIFLVRLAAYFALMAAMARWG